MLRHLTATAAALSAVAVMMPSAAATKWREWSEPVNVLSINTSFEEAGPAISKDGRELYFQTTRASADGNCDIFVAQRESAHDDWDVPVPVDAVNTGGCENSVSLSRDEHHLFFTRPFGDIWVSYRRDARDASGWEEPVRLGPTINTDTAAESTARHFASAKHGISQLFFYSNRPGGAGDADIYFADLFGGLPKPVVELNTPQIDAGAVLSKNGLEIFFHSSRPGVGKRDLWTAKRPDLFEPWGTPQLVEGLNTADDEWFPALSSDDETMFFASNRANGAGGNDIYMATRVKNHKD